MSCCTGQSPLPSFPAQLVLQRSLSSAWQEIANAKDAFGPWWCVPDSSHLTGPPADPGGRAGTCCAGLQSPEEAAATGSDACPATWQLFSEEAPNLSVIQRPRGPIPWKLAWELLDLERERQQMLSLDRGLSISFQYGDGVFQYGDGCFHFPFPF